MTVLAQSRTVRVKHTRYGLMMFNINDTFVGRSLDLYGEYAAAETTRILGLLEPGMTAIDVGANIGTITLPMAQVVGPGGRVWAFEAQATMFHMLCGNVALNDLTNVVAAHAVVGADAAVYSVPGTAYDRTGNFGAIAARKGTEAGSTGLRSIRLDDLDLPACHFIKIDVEGMELDVLRGAAGILDRHRPLLYVENDRPDNSASLLDFLMSHRYRMWWSETPLYSDFNFNSNLVNVFPGIVSLDVVCVPAERTVVVEDLVEIRSTDATPPSCRW